MILVKKEDITKQVVDAWYNEWETLRVKIHEAHTLRDGSARELMAQGIQHFEDFLVMHSKTDEPFSEGNEYELMPINGMERFQFIKLRPAQYACYRQLDELYKETKKRCARLRVVK